MFYSAIKRKLTWLDFFRS